MGCLPEPLLPRGQLQWGTELDFEKPVRKLIESQYEKGIIMKSSAIIITLFLFLGSAIRARLSIFTTQSLVLKRGQI